VHRAIVRDAALLGLVAATEEAWPPARLSATDVWVSSVQPGEPTGGIGVHLLGATGSLRRVVVVDAALAGLRAEGTPEHPVELDAADILIREVGATTEVPESAGGIQLIGSCHGTLERARVDTVYTAGLYAIAPEPGEGWRNNNSTAPRAFLCLARKAPRPKAQVTSGDRSAGVPG